MRSQDLSLPKILGNIREHVREHTPKIPCCPKIFLCNERESVFGNDPDTGGHDSLQRRIYHFNFDKAWGATSLN